MGSVTAWVTLISAAFALAGVLAGAFAVIRSKLIKVRIETLEGLVQNQELEIAGLERFKASQEADLKAVHAELDAEKRKVAALEDMKSARTEVLALTALVDSVASSTGADHTKILEALKKVSTHLDELVKTKEVGK